MNLNASSPKNSFCALQCGHQNAPYIVHPFAVRHFARATLSPSNGHELSVDNLSNDNSPSKRGVVEVDCDELFKPPKTAKRAINSMMTPPATPIIILFCFSCISIKYHTNDDYNKGDKRQKRYRNKTEIIYIFCNTRYIPADCSEYPIRNKFMIYSDETSQNRK